MFPMLPSSQPHNLAIAVSIPTPQCIIDADATYVVLDKIFPLTYIEFITVVLIPTTAVLLIQDDRQETRAQAWMTWYQSHMWGLLHSSNSDNPDDHPTHLPEIPAHSIAPI
jgi:hypothetical protein